MPVWKQVNLIFLILLAVSIVLLLYTKTSIRSSNDFSRLSSVDALYQHQSFIIEKPLASADITFDGQHWYSDKLPFLALITSGVYTGVKLALPALTTPIDRNPNATYYLLTLIFSGLPLLAINYFFYQSLVFTTLIKKQKILFLFILNFCTLLLPYATIYSNHVLTGLIVTMMLYYFLCYRQHPARKYQLILGLLTGLVLLNDLVLGFCLGLLLGIFFLFFERRLALTTFLIGCIPGLLLFAFLNLLITGSWAPPSFLIRFAYGQLPQNNWRGDINALSVQEIALNYLRAFIGRSKGLFIYTPFLLLVWSDLILTIKKIQHRLLAVGILAVSVLFIIIMVAITNDLGGGAYGLRWAVPLIPLWLWFSAYVWNNHSKCWQSWFLVLAALSLILTLQGLPNPWQAEQDVSLINLFNLYHP